MARAAGEIPSTRIARCGANELNGRGFDDANRTPWSSSLPLACNATN